MEIRVAPPPQPKSGGFVWGTKNKKKGIKGGGRAAAGGVIGAFFRGGDQNTFFLTFR